MASNSGNQQPKPNLSENIIQDIIRAEQSKINFKVEELKLKHKQLDSNEKLALEQLKLEHDLLSKEPKQKNDRIIIISLCVGILAIIFLGFIGFMTLNGHKDFALDFLKWVGYVIGLVFSFAAGRLSSNKSKEKDDQISNAQVIE